MTSRTVDILVTGASGFVGRRLARRLAEAFPDATILGADRRPPDDSDAVVAHAELDITDRRAVAALVAEHKPALVFHLAAQAHVPTSFAEPVPTWNVNLMGTLHLVEAVRDAVPEARFVHVGSAEAYGSEFLRGVPLAEDAAFAPLNPYAASKAAADLLVRQQAAAGLRAVVLRPFNHVGPGQRRDFVVSAFCSQIAGIERGLQEPVIMVGNLDARRDFLDVRDVLDAYVAVVARGGDLRPGSAYNLCSGRTVAIRDVLEDLLALSRVAIDVRVDAARLRPVEIPVMAGDAGAARAALSWEPRIPWRQTLADTLAYWRDTLA
ncbi:MAG: GDP-mannose 4,6-dehydratase [bacterium]|nr:GDP-mannose 4,6-dehydratase [bacterium]